MLILLQPAGVLGQCGLPADSMLATVTHAMSGSSMMSGNEYVMQNVLGLIYEPGHGSSEEYVLHSGLFPVVREIRTYVGLRGRIHYFTVTDSSDLNFSNDCSLFADGIKPVPRCEVVATSVDTRWPAISDTSISDSEGFFEFDSLPGQRDYRIRFSRPVLPRSQAIPPITGADATTIRDSLMHRSTFPLPAQKIAANVNSDTTVNISDLLVISQYVNQMKVECTIGSWRFLPDSICFPVNVRPISGLETVAVLVGDADASWCGEPHSLSKVTVAERQIERGETRTVSVGPQDTVRLSLPIRENGDVSVALLSAQYDFTALRFLTANVCRDQHICPAVSQAEVVQPGELRYLWALTGASTVPHSSIEIAFETIGTPGETTEVSFSNFWIDDKRMSLPKYRVEIAANGDLPSEYSLGQNYPNPFNPQTVIPYDIPPPGGHRVRIEIFDLQGRLVKVLVDRVQKPGRFKAEWDGRLTNDVRAASGSYYYRFKTAGFVQTHKMILLH